MTSKQSLGFLFSDFVFGLNQAKCQMHFQISLNGDLWVRGCVILNQGTHFLSCQECGLEWELPSWKAAICTLDSFVLPPPWSQLIQSLVTVEVERQDLCA